jgi:hypothetical protein
MDALIGRAVQKQRRFKTFLQIIPRAMWIFDVAKMLGCKAFEVPRYQNGRHYSLSLHKKNQKRFRAYHTLASRNI